MDDEFTLTDKQVENWRNILITMPLPPTNCPLGVYALIMSREMVVTVAGRINGMISTGLEEETIAMVDSIEPTNITRTRPRDPNKKVRR